MTHAALFLSLILGFNAPPPAQTCSLPGLWLGDDRSKDAVGMWLEFAPDGSVVRANGRIVDGEWNLKGDVLTLTGRLTPSQRKAMHLESLDPVVSQRVTMKVGGDQITRKADAAIMEVAREERRRGQQSASAAPSAADMPTPPVAIAWLDEHTLTRVTPAEAGQPAIVGVWGYKNKSGRAVLERYSAKRRFAVLEPMAAQRGTFTVAGTKLSVTADGATTEVPIVCGRDAFELEANGARMKFVKFQ